MARPIRITAVSISSENLRAWTVERAQEFVPVLKRVTETGWLVLNAGDFTWAQEAIPRYARGKTLDCLNMIVSVPSVVNCSTETDRWAGVEEFSALDKLEEFARYQSVTDGVTIENGWPSTQLDQVLGSSVPVRHLDIYDQFLLQSMAERINQRGLLDKSRKTALEWVIRDLDLQRSNAEVAFRLIHSRKSRFSLTPELETRLKEYMHHLSKEFGLKFIFELRGEKLVLRDDGRGSWFHGRFFVLDGCWVISTDRSLDWFADGVTVDNHLVRWGRSVFPAGRLTQRWSALPDPEIGVQGFGVSGSA